MRFRRAAASWSMDQGHADLAEAERKMSISPTPPTASSGIPAAVVIAGLLADAREAVTFDRSAARSLLARAIEILDSVPDAPRSGGLARWQMRRLEAFVEANISSSITLEMMAACVRLSPSHFGRAFKATAGETPYGFVLRRRVERARKLMLESSRPLAEIALDCGLADQSHLSRIFRRYSGISPNAWRRLARA